MELVLQDIKLSNPMPTEGDSIKVYAKLYNQGNRVEKVWAVFYYTTEFAFSKESIEKFSKPQYEIHRELIEDMGKGDKKEIVFDWVVKKDLKSIFVKTE